MEPICRRVDPDTSRQDFVPTWRQLQTILAAADTLVGLVAPPLCVEFFRGETRGLFDPRLMPPGRSWDEIMGSTPQPRKRRAPRDDLPSGASRSFNKPDATGHGDGAGSRAGNTSTSIGISVCID